MIEVLDEIENTNNSQQFSIRALILGLLTWGLFIFLISGIPANLSFGQGIISPSSTIAFSWLLACVLGVGMTIMSFKHKEKSGWIKWSGAFFKCFDVCDPL